MEIEKNIPLSDKNWFRTGGVAAFYSSPQKEDEFLQALEFFHHKRKSNHDFPLYILGEGANVLISDEGLDGLVITPKNIEMQLDKFERNTITAGAGVKINDLINFLLDSGYGDLEEFSGIPGTVGGAVYINLHYFNFLFSDFLQYATLIEIDSKQIIKVSKEWFNFSYDYSNLFQKKHLLLDATFKITPISPLEIAYRKGKRDEIIRQRNARYPNKLTCGSFFRNFLPQEIPFTIGNKKIVSVAYYLDKVGVKGELTEGEGRATVSSKHANMIVTSPEKGATSSDVISLAREMQKKVKIKYGITPHPECQLLGWKDDPLYS